MFDVVWSGRRHVIMGASQIDAYGNQNIALIGDPAKPKAQLLGLRGAPGNTINHTTSYWVPNHSPKVFVEQVDVVCGVGYDRARKLGPAERRFHHLSRVITNLGVLDFESSDHRMRLRTLHPGVTVDEIVAATGFELVIPDDVPESREPTDDEVRLIRDVIDPNEPAQQGGPRMTAPGAAHRGVRPVRRAVPDRADGHGLGGRRPADLGDERGRRARDPRVGDHDLRPARRRHPARCRAAPTSRSA